MSDSVYKEHKQDSWLHLQLTDLRGQTHDFLTREAAWMEDILKIQLQHQRQDNTPTYVVYPKEAIADLKTESVAENTPELVNLLTEKNIIRFISQAPSDLPEPPNDILEKEGHALHLQLTDNQGTAHDFLVRKVYQEDDRLSIQLYKDVWPMESIAVSYRNEDMTITKQRYMPIGSDELNQFIEDVRPVSGYENRPRMNALPDNDSTVALADLDDEQTLAPGQ